MISSQEEDEFVAVRVQDPRVQHGGSWSSYVDYKIFLHTNSKAFTAKTSCVRRRYSEFVWLKKKLQKNAGLVPVPDLPGKSLFFFSNEDFLEGRRKGLQVFLDKVVNMTVCLSDSQLHLFLQTQLPVGHIQDCVQGHTPYSVTDAILTYASSNRGFAQAQQEDESMKEHSLTVSYESMESPLPHQPGPAPAESLELKTEPPDGREQLLESDTEERPGENSLMTVIQEDDHLQAVVEDADQPSFFLGDGQEDVESRSHQIQTPVEVHCSVQTGFLDNKLTGLTSGAAEEQTGDHQASEEAQLVTDPSDSVQAVEDVWSETAENRLEATRNQEKQTEPDQEERQTTGSVLLAENDEVDGVRYDAEEQEELVGDRDGVKGENDDGSHRSSNESIIKVTDDESVCDEAEESLREESSSIEETLWSEGPNILNLHINGYPEELSGSLDTNLAVRGADLTENSDFSILEASGSPGLAEKKYLEEEESLPVEGAEVEAC